MKSPLKPSPVSKGPYAVIGDEFTAGYVKGPGVEWSVGIHSVQVMASLLNTAYLAGKRSRSKRRGE